MIQISLPDGSKKEFQRGSTPMEVAKSISEGFARNVISAQFNKNTVETSTPLNENGSLILYTFNDTEINNMTIPVTANIVGSYTNPAVKTDLTSGISNLTNQLIEIQKQKLLNQGKKEVSNLINDVIGGNQSKTDSLKKEQNILHINSLTLILKYNK